MQEKKKCWEQLCSNAEKFHLDITKFEQLYPFFETLDLEVFRNLVSQTVNEFPLEEVKQRFPKQDLVKLLLLCIVANYEYVVQLYRKETWPDNMLEEILQDLKVWLDTLERDIGGYGLTPRIFCWCVDCLKGEVKSFGRLQGNSIHDFFLKESVYRREDGSLQRKKAFVPGNAVHPDLTYHDKALNIHIPATGSLDRMECIRSLKRMVEFSETFQPDYDYKAIVCYSWLLDPLFQELLGPESNIVKFQKLGHVFNMSGHYEDNEIRWRLWGEKGRQLPLEQLPVKGSLQRGVVKTLQNGGHFHEGVMIIFKEELPALFAELC